MKISTNFCSEGVKTSVTIGATIFLKSLYQHRGISSYKSTFDVNRTVYLEILKLKVEKIFVHVFNLFWPL